MKTLEVKDIIKLSINEICVNPENPRHDEVIMDLGEIFIMQQLIKTKKDSQAMYKLIYLRIIGFHNQLLQLHIMKKKKICSLGWKS